MSGSGISRWLIGFFLICGCSTTSILATDKMAILLSPAAAVLQCFQEEDPKQSQEITVTYWMQFTEGEQIKVSDFQIITDRRDQKSRKMIAKCEKQADKIVLSPEYENCIGQWVASSRLSQIEKVRVQIEDGRLFKVIKAEGEVTKRGNIQATGYRRCMGS